MALPKLSGSGMARSAAGAIGKSVKNGVKAFGAMALSQMEPEVLTGIATAKMLKGKLKGKGAGGNSEADVAELKQSIEEIAPEINQTGIQSLTQQVEQVPPRTSEPIVQKIEELKEAKEAETNLEPVVEKLDELTPMLEKIDILTEENETDLFNVNSTLSSVDQGISSIASMFRHLLNRQREDALNALEKNREASRSKRTRSPFSGRDRTKQSKSGDFLGGIMDMFKGGLPSMLTSILGGAGGGALLGGLSAILGVALPIIIPLVIAAALAAGVYAFLQSQLAEDIKQFIADALIDPKKIQEEENKKNTEWQREFFDGLRRIEEEYNARLKREILEEKERIRIREERDQHDADIVSTGESRAIFPGGTPAILNKAADLHRINLDNQIAQLEVKEDALKKAIEDQNMMDPGFLPAVGRGAYGVLQLIDAAIGDPIRKLVGVTAAPARFSAIGGVDDRSSAENLGLVEQRGNLGTLPDQLKAMNHATMTLENARLMNQTGLTPLGYELDRLNRPRRDISTLTDRPPATPPPAIINQIDNSVGVIEFKGGENSQDRGPGAEWNGTFGGLGFN